MAAGDNAATARAFNEAYNARDWRAAAALSAPDVRIVNVATGDSFAGADGVRRYFEGWSGAFPDSRIETTLAAGDETAAVTEFLGRGTHSGPLPSPNGPIPPTGKRVEVHFCQVLEFQGGKITRARLYFDGMSLLGQLGLLPPPGGSPTTA